MNGRVYDTITGRFTSADPYIQAPYNSQSYNRYSYVMNNPVNLTDPSGYNWFSDRWHSAVHGTKRLYNNVKHWGQDHRDDIRQGVAIAAAVITTALTGGGAASAWASYFGSTAGGVIASGALAGAASGAIMTGSLKGAAQGALWGGITAGVSFGVAEGVGALTGVNAHGASFFDGVNRASVMKAVAHGLSSTLIQEVRYGTTKGAFLSGFVSSGFSIGSGAKYTGAFVMAIVGGTVSELGGGKFANGAWSSAFQYLFNDAAGNMLAKANEKDRLYKLGDKEFKQEMDFNGTEEDVDMAKMSLMSQITNSALIEDLPNEGEAAIKAYTGAIPAPKVDVKSLPGIFDFFTPRPSKLRFEYNCHTVGNCGVKIYE